MAEPIRVLHVLGCLNRGGAETMVMNLYRNMDRSKVQFDFAIHTNYKDDYEDEISQLGGIIYRIPPYKGKNHFQYIKAWRELFKSHPEYKIIHGHIRSTASIYLEIAKKHGLITIAHSHSVASRGNKLEQIIKNIFQLPIRHIADYLFACSDEAGKWLFGSQAVKRDNYYLIKNAIDINEYKFNEVQRKKLRESLNIDNRFVVGHVGSFTYPKNHKFIIDIFYALKKKNENAILLLVGDGDLRDTIKNKVGELRLSDSVIFTGVRSDLPELLHAMDAFLFPSLFEGLGMAIIEAQAAGLPCIVADTIPRDAYVTDLVEAISLNSPIDIWADAILKYIIIDADGRRKQNTYYEIEKSGYGIEENSFWLEKFYLTLK
jgi:glycosyltransferase involved in cell wall biosynthesis